MKLYTVSQIARRTKITVRTLHHYEAKGLLVPTQRSAAGYRLYGAEQLRRLQHIVALKSLGFSLAEIGARLDADAPSLGQALLRQVTRFKEAVVRQQELLQRLESVAQQALQGATIDAETLLSSLEATSIMEKYFTHEQLQSIKQRGAELGADHIRAVEQAWPDVIAGMHAAMQRGDEPASAPVQALARRWRELVREFTGGDVGVQRSLNVMYQQEPAQMQAKTGIDPKLMEYASRAIKLIAD